MTPTERRHARAMKDREAYEERPPMYGRYLPSGWRVALCSTGSGNPPGHHGGMATCSSEMWCRLVRDAWDSGWHRCGIKSLLKAKAWWDLVESEADIREAWDGCVGGVWPPPRYDDVYFKGREWLDSL